ncbi:rhamnogalacturonan acetylesterase [Rhodohalobacter sp. SW132]|uniref:rhamnogalacturonan acetylesterase n=1 Tax=Rhodohalobacter sp. SW132 TaxID=2293433 RepID=UPI001ADFC42E|nr:rhamnogalacturonan acetylesterase [Rhodohalobacter sp. SW132]
MIGDSTMSEKEVRAYPETGWGTPFAHYFESDVVVENHARNGRSTRTFLEEGRWDPIKENLNEGDYVFIQFGHNDEVQSKPQSTTKEEYQTNLVKYVTETLARNAQPVLLTPIARRHFDQNGDLVDTHELYSELMREVAQSENVPLIDMDRKSQELLKSLGPEKSRFFYNHLEPGQNPNYPNGLEDDTHFNELGARKMAELVIESIRELNLDLKQKIVQ